MKKIVPSNAILIPDDAQLMFQGVIFDTYQWQQQLFDGSKTTFEMIRRPDTVSVLGITSGKIIVIQDHQPHRGERLTFPGGRVDEQDSSIVAAAQREVAEETGYSFRNWRLVKAWQPQAKIEWFVYLYIAWDVLETTPTHLDSGEKITTKLLSLLELQKTLAAQKANYLREIADMLQNHKTINELLETPAFIGKEIAR